MKEINKMLSIIVPVYNVERYIERCVVSLVNQTYENKEIILVDDGSTDSSGQLCDRYAKEYSSVKVIHKKNGWQGEARNYGINASQGHYISFVDPDDWIELDGCERLISELERTHSDFVIGEFVTEYDNHTIPVRDLSSFEMSGHDAVYYNLNKEYLCSNSSCNKIYTRRFINNLRFPVGKKFEDTFFVQDALIEVRKVYKTGIPFYHHYQRSGSTTHHTFTIWHIHLVEAYERFYEKVKNQYRDLEPYCAARLTQECIDYINNALSSDKKTYAKQIRYCRRILKQMPVFTIFKYKNAVGNLKTVMQHLLLFLPLSIYSCLHKMKQKCRGSIRA